MSDSQEPDNDNDFPEIEEDPEILALLDFEPVVRKVKRVADGWGPEPQREFIRRLARTGSPFHAVSEMGKNLSGVQALYRALDGASFRASWDEAIAIARRRKQAEQAGGEAYFGPVPGIVRRAAPSPVPSSPRAQGESDDDAESFQRRVEDAHDSITGKLLRARRLYLQEISVDPVSRAAFEILTELPVDWDKAERLEAQPDEPWRPVSLRSPDMLLTAEAGWLGEVTRGPDKKAELIRVINRWLVENGREAVDFDAE